MAVSNVASPREYVCPGEYAPITRAVHLARLAAAFPACRRCPFGESSQHVPGGHRISRSLFTKEGLRGVFRNELNEEFAERVGTAVAALLRSDSDEAAGRPSFKSNFPVVIASDDRPWSARLAVAAGAAFRRSGCETIDIGLATGPLIRFAVAKLNASAGVIATGAGGGPAVAGFDVVLGGGRPASAGGTLDRLADHLESNVGRMTRTGGPHRVFDPAPEYEALLQQCLSFGPTIRCVVGTSSLLVRDWLERLAGGRRPGARIIELPRRATETGSDPDGLLRIAAVVRDDRADFGFWIDEAGTSCRVIDDTGNAIPVAHFAELLLNDAAERHPTSAVAVDWPLAESRELRRREVIRSNGTAEAMFVSMRDHAAIAGADSAGRFWQSEPTVASDALMTLGRLLRILEKTDRSLSQRIAAIGSPDQKETT